MEGITARTGQPAVRHVAAVERAFAVLDALADGQELGTNEIARRTGINASTVSRLLATLVAARFVEHVPESGRYRLSLRLVELGNAVLGRLDLRDLARPHLQALVRETGETATLSAPGEHDADHGRLRPQLVGRPERRPARPAERRPRDRGREGDARVRRRRAPARAARGFTPRTITTRAELVEELERVRRTRLCRGQGGARGRSRGRGRPRVRQPRRRSSASSASRARRRGSTWQAMRGRCRRCSRARPPVGGAWMARPRSSEGDALRRPYEAGSQTRQAARSRIRFVSFA